MVKGKEHLNKKGKDGGPSKARSRRKKEQKEQREYLQEYAISQDRIATIHFLLGYMLGTLYRIVDNPGDRDTGKWAREAIEKAHQNGF